MRVAGGGSGAVSAATRCALGTRRLKGSTDALANRGALSRRCLGCRFDLHRGTLLRRFDQRVVQPTLLTSRGALGWCHCRPIRRGLSIFFGLQRSRFRLNELNLYSLLANSPIGYLLAKHF